MRTATQEILAQRHEGSKIHGGIWSKVMKLHSEKVQETPEKRMRGQGESAVDVSGDKDTLTLERLRLDLVPREACRFVENESPLDQVINVFPTNHRGHPIALDPAPRQGRPRGRSAPAGLLCLRLRCRLLSTLQGRRLLLHRHRRRSSNGPTAPGREQRWRRNSRRKGGNEGALFKSPGPAAYMELLPSD